MGDGIAATGMLPVGATPTKNPMDTMPAAMMTRAEG